jgi:hypothetical protein
VVIGGVVGFLVWKNGNDNKIVSAKSGTVYYCTQCGQEYKNDVKTVKVKNKDKGNYSVETKNEGLCDNCTYGSVGVQYKKLFGFLSTNYFKSAVALSQPSIDFLKAHQDFFPAPNQATANSLTNPVDARLISKDVTPYTGTLVKVYGIVVKTDSQSSNGGTLTTIQVSPVEGGDLFYVFYTGNSPVLANDYGYFWVLPVATTIYQRVDGGTDNAVVSIGAWCEKAGNPYGF